MDFIKQFESASLVPAGGAAAAYAFCLGAAMIYKVSLIENRRAVERPDLEKKLPVLKKEIERLLRDAEKLVTEDAEAYLKFRKSRRENDSQAMKLAFSKAMDVSLKVNGKEVAQGRVPAAMSLHFTSNATFDIGTDLDSPVSLDYFDQAPFAFNGTIGTTTIKYLKK